MSAPSGIGIYDARICRAWCELSMEHFDHYNRTSNEALTEVGGGCLDAPEAIPAGSVKSFGTLTAHCYPAEVWIGRDAVEYYADLAAREAIADKLIAEILAEEGMTNDKTVL